MNAAVGPAQRKRGGAHANDERIAAEEGLREHFDALAAHETQFHQTPLSGGERAIVLPDAQHGGNRTGRQYAQAGRSWSEGDPRRGGDGIHGGEYR